MFELFKEINWTLIGTLIIVGAIVAWTGDYIGMRLGKKRITLFKLRPRHTSRVITILTGVGIAIFTLFAISTASETVRTALFSMNYVKNQVTSLTAELQSNKSSLDSMEIELFRSKGELQEKQVELQNISNELSEKTEAFNEIEGKISSMQSQLEETKLKQTLLTEENTLLAEESKKLESSLESLKQESERLRVNMQRLREGRIAALTGEILAQSVVAQKSYLSTELDEVFSRLSDEASALLAFRFGKKKEDVLPPILDEESKNAVRANLQKTPTRWVVRMTATSNAVDGEAVRARVDSYKTRLIYEAGSLLIEKTIKAKMDRPELEELIFKALKDLNTKAVEEGLLRDPLTGNVGSVDMTELMDVLNSAVDSPVDKKLQIIAADDIYTEGPVKVSCVLK